VALAVVPAAFKNGTNWRKGEGGPEMQDQIIKLIFCLKSMEKVCEKEREHILVSYQNSGLDNYTL